MVSQDDMLTCVNFSFDIILKRKKSKKGGEDQEMLQSSTTPGCFAIIVLQMYCYYKCSVALPHGAVDWTALCGCGIS